MKVWFDWIPINVAPGGRFDLPADLFENVSRYKAAYLIVSITGTMNYGAGTTTTTWPPLKLSLYTSPAFVTTTFAGDSTLQLGLNAWMLAGVGVVVPPGAPAGAVQVSTNVIVQVNDEVGAPGTFSALMGLLGLSIESAPAPGFTAMSSFSGNIRGQLLLKDPA
jgi:hypothetical protein